MGKIWISWDPTLFRYSTPIVYFGGGGSILYPTASKREFSQVTRVTLGSSKKFSVASHDMKFVFASFLTIISISQSKRGGRTTRRSDSMVGNASKWWFLKFHAHWAYPNQLLEIAKVMKNGYFFFFYRCRERKKCQNTLELVLKVAKYLGEGLCKILWS